MGKNYPKNSLPHGAHGRFFCKNCRRDISNDAIKWLKTFYSTEELRQVIGAGAGTARRWSRMDRRCLRKWGIVLFPPFVAQEYYDRYKMIKWGRHSSALKSMFPNIPSGRKPVYPPTYHHINKEVDKSYEELGLERPPSP